MPPKPSGTVRQSVATLNLARAFHEHIHGLKSSRRMGESSTDVEVLEKLSELTDKAAHVLHGLLNGCRPINRLPPEVLATIFYFVPRPYSLPTQLTTFHAQALIHTVDLLPITATCHHWREVALHTPRLWSTIVDNSSNVHGRPPLYTRYLHRCSHGPLNFYLAHNPSPETLSLLGEHNLRVQEAFFASIESPSSINIIASTSLPGLRSCIFTGCLSDHPVVPLIPGGCPRLESLSLTNTTFIPSSGFASLIRLHIEHPHGGSQSSSYSLGDLFTFLSGCYALRTLYLVGIGASDVKHTDTGQGFVVLHHLERLALIENTLHGRQEARIRQMDFYRTFLSRLSIPNSCVMRFGEVLPSDISSCMDVAGLTDGPTFWRIHHDGNTLYARDPNLLCLQVFNAAQGRYIRLDVRTPPREGPVPEDTLHLSTALSQASVFANAREVWTESSAEWVWKTGPESLLSHMSQLESLVICRDPEQTVSLSDSGILDALEVKEGTAPEDIACPLLTTLRVDCVTDDDAVCALRLAASRAAAGRPLTRVVLGRALWPRKRSGMLHVYDSAGEVIKVGNMRADGLWDHWMSQLSSICLDESEDCEPYWRSWRWDPTTPEYMKWCQLGLGM
ncbi:hypothetical protein BD311DRAFT_683095 [Dichomitus squalens]|uniref:F-box domain-containing protein n=1 Tax=Dichomitus squalens TaxID=114155 RepID=A0A4V2K1T2_9APHY|nr:hypothetical protein BD311DRAFT_683095 [Dichomitus squalens]